ncbi:MAG TPA: hypothetical protein VNE67_02175 [Acetobacteraceae bacterium]|nr:hypothetical protein [Acetobacteraceae bacterium]
MPISLSRRAALLLPLLLAACGGEAPAPVSYTPLDYSYLPPLQLNVARVEVEQHFIPSDQPPSVNQYDPVSPTAALRRMAVERLKPFGSAGRAVFVIENASLVQGGDTITGTFTVRLEIYTSAGTRAAFAEATVSRQVVGEVHNLSETLYLLTRQLMDRMNVELEYQIRRSLGDWLVAPGAQAAPVQAAPLMAPGGSVPAYTAPAYPASPGAQPPSLPPPSGLPPQSLAPPSLTPLPLVPVAPAVVPPAR